MIAATDSRLPVAVGPIRYTETNVELEVSYAISQGPRITYHHMLYELTVKMTPRQKVVTPKSLVGLDGLRGWRPERGAVPPDPG